MDRRHFLTTMGVGAGLAIPGLTRALTGPAGPAPPSAGLARRGNPMARPRQLVGDHLRLVARPATVDVGIGRSEAWTIDGALPSPTIRLRRGDKQRIELLNQLPEPTILHWHGLTVPEAADGHPRFAIDPGETYVYEFEVRDRAGTYWYHPHTHRRTAPQTYRGMGGFVIVEDDEEAALELPSDEYEIPLVLQDKRLSRSGEVVYDPAMGHDVMMGYLGGTAFGNGVADPTVEVKRGVYRLRVLNGSNARIFDLGFASGLPLTLIGADGGLLEAPQRVSRVMLATGERADVLVDFSDAREGDRLTLRSFAFEVPGMTGMTGGMGRGMRGRMGGGRGMGGMMGMFMQGEKMDLVEFVVAGGPVESQRPLPGRLSEIRGPEPSDDAPRRTFRFESAMMRHAINGREFEMTRVDERVPLGRTEVWTLVNEAAYAHPVHVHVGSFRVLARRGGRGRVMPWETGLKDTVLVMPGESVDVAVRFADYEGLFLMHCHNLEHEDAGMMANFEVRG